MNGRHPGCRDWSYLLPAEPLASWSGNAGCHEQSVQAHYREDRLHPSSALSLLFLRSAPVPFSRAPAGLSTDSLAVAASQAVHPAAASGDGFRACAAQPSRSALNAPCAYTSGREALLGAPPARAARRACGP